MSKQARVLSRLWLLLLVTALACNFATDLVENGDETPVVDEFPTQVPASTEAPIVTEAPSEQPTDTPEVSPTEQPPTEPPPPTEAPETAAFELDSIPYVDPDGLFEIVPPAGWSVEPDEGGVSFNAPDDSGFVNVEMTNTGLFLDGDSFERFVDAREENFFGGFADFEILNRQVDPIGGSAQVTKRLAFDDIPQLVRSVYEQRDEVILALDFWAEIDLAPAYSDKYDEIVETVAFDSSAAFALLDPYAWIYDFYGPGDLFSISVPIPWRYELTEGDVAIVDTFYSPDEHGIIQNIAFDDGTEVSKSDAGAKALELLRESYADDIRITDDQVQADGSERLTWNSPGGDYSGISFFETRGTTFLLFTVLWDNPFEAVHIDVLDYTISTYVVPE